MAPSLPVLIIGGAVAIILVIVIAVLLYEKKRRETLAAIAQEFGLSFSVTDPLGIPARYAMFRALSAGRSQKAGNVLHGELGGIPIAVFDYHYVTGSSNSSTSYNISAAVADTRFQFEYVGIRTEKFFDRLADMVGFGDVEIGAADFDGMFRISAQDPEFAKRLLQKGVTDFLMSSEQRDLDIEFAGRSILVHKERRLKPDDLGRLVKFLLELTRKLPANLPPAL